MELGIHVGDERLARFLPAVGFQCAGGVEGGGRSLIPGISSTYLLPLLHFSHTSTEVDYKRVREEEERKKKPLFRPCCLIPMDDESLVGFLLMWPLEQSWAGPCR